MENNLQVEETPEVKQLVDYSKELALLPTTSSRIRFLDSKNYTRSQIAITLNKRYQHIRNVLITPIKKAKV